MAKGEDWIKKNHLEFNKQLRQTNTYFTKPANLTRWGFTTGGPMEAWVKNTYLPQVTLYDEVYEAWLNDATRTSVTAGALKREERNMQALYRKLYMGFLHDNPLVTEDDLREMGLPVPSNEPPHDADVAETPPASRVDTSVPRILKIFFGREIMKGTNVKKGKPDYQIEVEIRWLVSERPALELEELVNVAIDTNSPYELAFKDKDRGKCFSYSMRWINTRGVGGPWSLIVSIYIP